MPATTAQNRDKEGAEGAGTGPGKSEGGEGKKPAGEGEDRLAPMHSIFVSGSTLYGLETHEGNGFYFVARNAGTGKLIFRREYAGYGPTSGVGRLFQPLVRI